MDRNVDTQNLSICVIESLSARRAWIEMHFATLKFVNPYVALRKESVDRNFPVINLLSRFLRRSPQGERG